MMKRIFLFQIVFALFWIKGSLAICGELNLTIPYGRITYRTIRSENCTWRFIPPDSSKDLMLILRFRTTSLYVTRLHQNFIELPNGIGLPKPETFNSFVETCFQFVSNDSLANNCHHKLSSAYCADKNRTVVTKWPPILSSVTSPAYFTTSRVGFYMSFDLDYLFVGCFKASMPLTDNLLVASPAPATSPAPSTAQTGTTSVISIVLGVILALLAILFIIFFILHRKKVKLQRAQNKDDGYTSISALADKNNTLHAGDSHRYPSHLSNNDQSETRATESNYQTIPPINANLSGSTGNVYLQPVVNTNNYSHTNESENVDSVIVETVYNMIPDQNMQHNILYHSYNTPSSD